MSGVLRSVKNVTKGYSAVQVKVRNATSNNGWGPTGGEMADIARITFNSSTDFYEVMDMLDKRLNDKGKNWRHVLKSLKVLDYCLHEGSELVVTWARKNIYIIKTLREFIYLDEDNRDVGASIRHSAKELTSLILDEERLRAERANRGAWKSRVTGLDELPGGGETSRPPIPRDTGRPRPQGDDEDDVEYRLALEASKNEADAEAERRRHLTVDDGDDDLAKAIRLSREEEDSRKRELEGQNQQNLLFDDTPVQTQPTGFNQGYQQQAAVDWFGNPVQQQQQQQQQQQPQQTGYLNNVYNVQPQQTGFQNGYGGGYGYQQPQQTGFDTTQQQQAQYLQPQQTYNPWAQQMQQQQQPIQEQPTATPGSNNPWASTQPTHSPIGVQPTGSNNPFAAQRPQTTTPVPKMPALSALQEQQTAFQPRPNPISGYTAPQQQAPQQQKPQDPYTARLNALLATSDGQDTFGNTGETRIPAQHTAPGTFVNSAGAGSMGRLEAAKTGNNPFYSQQPSALSTQYTGMPTMQYPAQTGPAFGARPAGQQQQSGSLIDL